MTPEQLAATGTVLNWLKDVGVLGGALLVIRMLLSGDIVTRREFERSEAEKLEWRRLALRGTDDLVIPLVREVRRATRTPTRTEGS